MSAYQYDNYVGVRTHEKYSIGTSGTLVSASGRVQRVIEFYNEGPVAIYLFNANDASAAVDRGRILASGGFFNDVSSDDAWWAFTMTGTANLRMTSTETRAAASRSTPNL